jgi:hypothetical protein
MQFGILSLQQGNSRRVHAVWYPATALQVNTCSLGQIAEAFMSALEVLDLAGKGQQVEIMHCSDNFEFGNQPLQLSRAAPI